ERHDAHPERLAPLGTQHGSALGEQLLMHHSTAAWIIRHSCRQHALSRQNMSARERDGDAAPYPERQLAQIAKRPRVSGIARHPPPEMRADAARPAPHEVPPVIPW